MKQLILQCAGLLARKFQIITNNIALAVLLLLASVPCAPAAEVYWIDGTTATWTNVTAWNPGSAPAAGNNYYVTNSSDNCQSPNGTAAFLGDSLTLSSGATLTLIKASSGGGTFTYTIPNLTNNGSSILCAKSANQNIDYILPNPVVFSAACTMGLPTTGSGDNRLFLNGGIAGSGSISLTFAPGTTPPNARDLILSGNCSGYSGDLLFTNAGNTQGSAVGTLAHVALLVVSNSAGWGSGSLTFARTSGNGPEVAFLASVTSLTSRMTLLGASAYVVTNTTLGSLAGDSAALVTNAMSGVTFDVGSDNTTTTFSGLIVGAGNFKKSGGGSLTLGGANTYTGNTTIDAGTLALGASGALASGSNIKLAAGATFDVSALASYTLGGGAGLSASGAGTGVGTTAAAINGGTTVDLGTRPVTLVFTPTTFAGDATHQALYISGGSLTLNGQITITNNSASPLGVGAYKLITQASGTISGSPTFGGVFGQGLAPSTTASLNIVGGDVVLVVNSLGNLPATATLTRHAGTGSSTTYGDAVSFDVTLSPSAATGTVVLLDDNGNGLGTNTLTGGACTITPALNALKAGTHTNIVASYSGGGGYLPTNSLPLSAQTVAQKALTVTGAAATSKYYDTTTAAILTGTLIGVISGDTVTYGTGTFANAGPGTGILVTSSSTLGGAAGANYYLSSLPTGLSADIYATSVWTGAAADTLWGTPGNWANGLVPDGANITADFSTLDLLGDTTVNLAASRTIGNLIFGDTDTNSAGSWFLANNSTPANVLTLAGASPTITVNVLGDTKRVNIGAVVAGSSGLIKQGDGVLNLTAKDIFSGPITIGAGTLSVGGSGQLGLGIYVDPVTNNGTLQFNSSITNTLAGTISGTGLLVSSSSGALTLMASNTYSGGTSLSGSGALTVTTNSALGTGLLTMDGSASRLDIAGAVTLNNPITINAVNPGTGNGAINGIDTNTATINGAISINGGTTHFGNRITGTLVVNSTITATVPVGVRQGNVYFNGGGSYTSLLLYQGDLWLGADNGISTQAVVFVTSISGRTGTLHLNGHNQTLAGLLGPTGTSTATVNMGSASGTLTLNTSGANSYAGSIAGSNLSLVITGTGNQTLTGTNTYAGNTTISGGTLALGGYGSISNTPNINIAAGANFDVSGSLASPSWMLLAGQALSGSGTVSGNVTANGTVSVGASIGTLTFNNDLTLAGTNIMKITKTGGLTNDVIVIGGNSTFGGVLQVVLTGSASLAVNDTFKLFNFSTSPGGSFASVNLPASYTWDTTQLAVNGTIKVSGLVAPPSFTNTKLSGGNLVMTGTGGTPGADYYLVGTTNLSAPTVWFPVLTNTFDISGNFSNAVPIDPLVPRTFYRLLLP